MSKPCRSGHTDCTVDCGWCKGTGVMPPLRKDDEVKYSALDAELTKLLFQSAHLSPYVRNGLIFARHVFIPWEKRGCLSCGRAKWRHRPRKIVCVKPRGAIATLPTTSQGVHPAWNPTFQRRIRTESDEIRVEPGEER